MTDSNSTTYAIAEKLSDDQKTAILSGHYTSQTVSSPCREVCWQTVCPYGGADHIYGPYWLDEHGECPLERLVGPDENSVTRKIADHLVIAWPGDEQAAARWSACRLAADQFVAAWDAGHIPPEQLARALGVEV